jgi:2-polyprenyl-3-methyl-5-hydroxy-6-metoxy-1,4-benzoquinol methylase
LQARKIALANKFKLIKSHKKIGTILDFGCGTGEFLKYMSSRKWNGYGVEPAENARTKANQLLDITNETVFEKLEDLASTKFDIITLWHVLEHVPEPGRLLTSLKNILAKDGLIIVAVPNHESYDANYYKDHWAGYDVPRHFWHFASSQLQTLMKNQGLKLSTIAPMKLDAYYVSLLSEKYKNNGRHNLATPFNAFFRGLTSNAKAKKSMNYSSLIYIARHE